MTDRIRPAFAAIHAEEALKEKTIAFLREEIERRQKREIHAPARRLAVGFALLLSLAFAGALSMNIYYTEIAYIDFDVNPSVELAVNQFDRVIGVYAYNSDGENALESLKLKHKTYEEAVSSMLGAFSANGYLRDNGLVSVTLQTNDGGRESEMLSGLERYVQTSVSAHHGSVQIDVFSVSEPVRNDAHALELTPAKYLAILELQEVDPAATVEGCRNHTLGELKSLTQSHDAGHHAQNDAGYGGGAHHGRNHRHG